MAKKPKADETAAAPTTASTDEITIAGQVFSVPVRYAAGHVLTEGEASALNQTYHENLRNNFAKTVKDARVVPANAETGAEASTKELTESDVAALQSELDTYAAQYEFGVRTASTRVPADPVAREAINIAKEVIRAKLRETKQTATAEQVAELANKLVERDGKYHELAQQRVDAMKAIADASLGDLAA